MSKNNTDSAKNNAGKKNGAAKQTAAKGNTAKKAKTESDKAAKSDSKKKSAAKAESKADAKAKTASKNDSETDSKNGKKKRAPLRKTDKVLITIIAVLAVAGGVFAGIILNLDFGENFLHNGTGFIDDTHVDTDGDGIQDDDDKSAVEALSELRDSSDLSGILKNWATSSTDASLMKSKDVINFLLIGVDAGGGNSDSIIMLTVNKKTHKLFLTSFMRDSYTYIKTKYGDKYAKVNASYANGGADCLVETIENDYKIAIDHYVSVNFNTFKEIVDAMGGVTVPVQEYEARAMRNEGGYTGTYGDAVTLNGEDALTFCRIRHCDADADVSRTRRQRTFITSIIHRSQDISMSQVSNVIGTLLKYVRTDCSTADLISLATQGLLGKWYNYEIITTTEPIESCRLDYSGYAWVWIVDYPAAAQDLQKKIYGETNITLNENRVTAIDVMKRGNSGNARP